MTAATLTPGDAMADDNPRYYLRDARWVMYHPLTGPDILIGHMQTYLHAADVVDTFNRRLDPRPTRHVVSLPSHRPDRTFHLSVVERHIRSDKDRDAGIRDVPVGSVNGDLELIRYALPKMFEQMDAACRYEIHFYQQNEPFGYNERLLVGDTFDGEAAAATLDATVTALENRTA
jgi:hypothetical protein